MTMRKIKTAGDNVLTIDDQRCAVIEMEANGIGVALFNIPEMQKVHVKGGDYLEEFAQALTVVFTDGEGRVVHTRIEAIVGVHPELEGGDPGKELDTYGVLAEFMPMGMSLRLNWAGVSKDDAEKISGTLLSRNVPTPPPGVHMLGAPENG